MAKSLLDQLSEMTVVVADTGDIQSIRRVQPRDATTNPSLITAAAQMPEYAPIVDEALLWSTPEAGPARRKTRRQARHRPARRRVRPPHPRDRPGPRLDRGGRAPLVRHEATVDKAHALIKQYEAAGATRGACSSRLPRRGRGFAPRRSSRRRASTATSRCSSGCIRRSPAPRRRSRSSRRSSAASSTGTRRTPGKGLRPARGPGVQSVTRIYDYYKQYGYKTEVMGASFRNIGRDRRARRVRSPHHRASAPRRARGEDGRRSRASSTRPRPRRRTIDAHRDGRGDVPRDARDGSRWRRTSSTEGIEGFTKALVALEKQLAERLDASSARLARGDAAKRFFTVYDLDGDGFITREEWARGRRGLRRARQRPRRAHHPGRDGGGSRAPPFA